MNAQEFVASWKREKDSMLDVYMDPRSESSVARDIDSLNLSADQLPVMRKIVNDILTDTFYSLLLFLDGEANIGGVQAIFKIHDEEGNVISDCGELEAEAGAQFCITDE